MAIIRYIPYVFVFFLLISCSSEHKTKTSIINKKVLTATETNDGYIIYLDKSNIVKLVNDTTKTTQLVIAGGKKISLNFYIVPPYLTNAYVLDINGLGRVLAFESYTVGASGLSANIINVSMILLDEPYLNKVLSYNSFYAGINLITCQDNKIYLNIYDYNGTDENGNIIYCLNTFEFTSDGFIRKDVLKNCYIFVDNKLVSYDDCNCTILKKPFVYII